jgi:hypothetical protein
MLGIGVTATVGPRCIPQIRFTSKHLVGPRLVVLGTRADAADAAVCCGVRPLAALAGRAAGHGRPDGAVP